jgi:integrase
MNAGRAREQFDREAKERHANHSGRPSNHLERVLNPKKLGAVTSSAMSRLQADRRADRMPDTTLDTHLAHLQAAFSWAVQMGTMAKVPNMHRPKRVKGRKLMRGRPITAEEFERMIAVAEKVRPHDFETWQRYLRGLWLSGLRLEESLAVSWDPSAPFAVDLTGKRLRFRIFAEAEKGNTDRLLPMTPDFAEFLLQTPEEDRHGPIFTILGLQTGRPITGKRISKILTKIGKKAGVVVDRRIKREREKIEDPETGEMILAPSRKLVEREVVKYASAHELRRAFGTRWAPRVKPATLQLLMRHSAIETTLRYYVAQDADDVAEELWKSFAPTPAESEGKRQERAPECESPRPLNS